MTMTAIAPADAKHALFQYLGVSESPPNSNHNPFSTCCGRPPEAWCADYQSCVFYRDLGFTFATIGLPSTGTAGCSVFVGALKRAGVFSFIPREHAWVFFGPGGGSHIEYVVALVRDGTGRAVGLDTIGGNTSAPNNYAGGTVAAHRRMFGPGDDIYGYGYIAAPAAPPQPTPTPAEDDDVRPFILKKNADPTAWLVVSDGTKLVRLQMTDGNDLRNPPDGYGPVIEVADADLDAIARTH